MSETVHYRGVLTEVERLENETLEDQCKRMLKNKTMSWSYDSYREMLQDEFYDKYIIHNDKIYSIDRKTIDVDEDIFHASKNINGTIDFEVKYYNGGCGFSEAIAEALKEVNKQIHK